MLKNTILRRSYSLKKEGGARTADDLMNLFSNFEYIEAKKDGDENRLDSAVLLGASDNAYDETIISNVVNDDNFDIYKLTLNDLTM